MNQTILITGCSGYIGSQLTRQLVEDHNKVIGIDKDSPQQSLHDFIQLDFKDRQKQAIETIFRKYNIDTVLHLAAEKNLGTCEEYPRQAKRINVHSTLDLLSQVRSNGSHFIYISSDQIFDGEKFGPYTREDTPRPLNIYGVTKAMSESILRTYEKSAIVRTAMVYDLESSLEDSRYLAEDELIIQGEIIPHAKIRLSQGKPFRLPVNEIINPTSVPTLVDQLTTIIDNKITGIQHCSGSTSISKYRFGEIICEEFGLEKRYLEPFQSDNDIRPENVSLSTESTEVDLGFKFPSLRAQLRNLPH